MQEFREMIIYCDGSCLGNPGPGGWGAVFIQGSKIKKTIKGFDPNTTNNRMELTAAINALKLVKSDLNIKIYTDSTYLKNGITDWINKWKLNNWNKGKIKNVDLWKDLDFICATKTIYWHWVKAHNGNEYNELADKLAKEAITKKFD